MSALRRTAGAFRQRGGESLVEFALIIPFVLLLLFGIFEFGRVLHTYLVVVNGAREGARFGAVGVDVAEIVQKVNEACPSLNPALLTIQVTGAGGPRGDPVSVQVIYPVDILTPLIEDIFPADPFPVSGEAVMRIE
jgi:Flp pilus assembly protein TadG